MPRWGMVIDLERCMGCWSCTISCKQVHFLPPGMFWNRVVIGETGKYPNTRKEMMPVLCNHCEDAGCVKVCPTEATYKREDGIVVVDYDKCMGCRYCVIACPYQQRTFNDGKRTEYFPGQGQTTYEKMGKKLYPLQVGTVVKCNFCFERVDKGLAMGLTPGVDREATPVCVNSCACNARVFGDLDDANSEVSRLIKEKAARPLHPEFGTEPSVYYVKL